MKSPIKSPVKTTIKSSLISPRNNKSSLKNQTPMNKFKVIKECDEQNPEFNYKQQVATLKKYISQLQTMISEHNIQYLYMKGLMEMEHKRGIQLETKNNLQTKTWQNKMAAKQKQQQQRRHEIELLKRQIQSYRSNIKDLNYQKQVLEGENRIKQNQLEQYKCKMECILRDKDQQIQKRDRKEIQRNEQIQSMRELEKKTKQINKFSKQQFFIIGKMQELSYLIQKQTSEQFIIEDTKRIQTLENRIRLNSLEYQNQLIKLKNQIKKINQCFKQQMATKEKQIKAQMLCKYQSKINLIPNLKNQIKKLEEKVIEKEKMMETLQRRQLIYKIMEMGKADKGLFGNDKIVCSQFHHENSNSYQSLGNQDK